MSYRNNREIASLFRELGKLMEFHGENHFKIRSYYKAYDILKLQPNPILTLSENELYNLEGIGKAIVGKIQEIKEKQTFDTLEKFRSKTPSALQKIIMVRGTSPAKLGEIYRKYDVQNLDQILKILDSKKILKVKGFGKKTADRLKKTLTYYKESKGKRLWAQMDAIAGNLKNKLKELYPDEQWLYTGEFRRANNILNKLEMLTTAKVSKKELEEVGVEVLNEENHISGIYKGINIEIIYSGKEEVEHNLLITTGPDPFISYLKKKNALTGDYKGEWNYKKIPYIIPELRDWEEMAVDLMSDDLLTTESVKGVIHAHSHYSDGRDNLEAMARHARDWNYEYLVISDHSQAAFYANGMTEDDIKRQHQEIDELNEKLHPFHIFKGIEVDIMGDGGLDYDERILQMFEIVIASVHSQLHMDLNKATERIITALKNPLVDILGHSSGRLLLSRQGYPLDYQQVFETAAEYDVIVEINANPNRLDIDWRYVPIALNEGLTLSINPDAHSTGEMERLEYGVNTARKGGLTVERNFSSRSRKEIIEFLNNRNR